MKVRITDPQTTAELLRQLRATHTKATRHPGAHYSVFFTSSSGDRLQVVLSYPIRPSSP